MYLSNERTFSISQDQEIENSNSFIKLFNEQYVHHVKGGGPWERHDTASVARAQNCTRCMYVFFYREASAFSTIHTYVP